MAVYNNKWLPFLTAVTIFLLTGCFTAKNELIANTSQLNNQTPLRVGIGPYPDMAWLVNIKNLKLEKKYATNVELITMPWEELLPAVASAGPTIDISFASLCDYLAKESNLNTKTDDPVLYIYPTWVFHGGGFVSFNPAVPELNAKTIQNPEIVKKFLRYKIGIQKNSCNQMLLWTLARKANVKLSSLNLLDTTFDDGILAAESGNFDIVGASAAQQMEIAKQHGRFVLTMDTMNVTAPAGIICKRSTYEKRKDDINAFIKMWFDCVNYVLNDIDHHSESSLAYLRAHASTECSLEQFKSALSLEYFPRSIPEVQKEITSNKGKYSSEKATKQVNEYLINIGNIKTPKQNPHFITIE